MSLPWDSLRIILNVKKTLPLIVVAIIIDILSYSARPDDRLFWLALALTVTLALLFIVQGYLVHVERTMALRKRGGKR